MLSLFDGSVGLGKMLGEFAKALGVGNTHPQDLEKGCETCLHACVRVCV